MEKCIIFKLSILKASKLKCFLIDCILYGGGGSVLFFFFSGSIFLCMTMEIGDSIHYIQIREIP